MKGFSRLQIVGEPGAGEKGGLDRSWPSKRLDAFTGDWRSCNLAFNVCVQVPWCRSSKTASRRDEQRRRRTVTFRGEVEADELLGPPLQTQKLHFERLLQYLGIPPGMGSL